MKRFLCLILCALMLSALCLTGCSGSSSDEDVADDITEAASDSTKTLTMYIISENKVCNNDKELAQYLRDECNGDSDSEKYLEALAVKQAYDDVEAAINKLTKSKYKTQLNIYFYTEDEYYDKVESILEYNREKYENGEIETAAPGASDEEETIINADFGNVELKYPDEKTNQIDILYVSGYDRYAKYADNEWLSVLNGELSGNSKILNSQIFPYFLEAAKYNYSTYAIPNNNVVGDYTYMLLNKEIIDENFFNLSDFTSISDSCVSEYIDLAANNYPDMITIYGDVYSCMSNYAYLTVDADTLDIYEDTFSIIGFDKTSEGPMSLDKGEFYAFSGLFSGGRTYTNLLLKLKEYEYLGYYGDASDGQPFAISVIKGSASEVNAKYGDDYYLVPINIPEADCDDLCGDMLAVSSYTVSLAGSMEFITYLNTDETIRNLLQYGIQGTNYSVNSDGCAVYSENNRYWMDVNKTGNVLLAYPTADCGMTAAEWRQYFKDSNADALKTPLYGFEQYLKNNADFVDKELIEIVNNYSAIVKNLIDSYTPENSTIEEFTNFISELRSNNVERLQLTASRAGSSGVTVYNRDLYKFSTMSFDPYMYCPAARSNELTLAIRDELSSVYGVYIEYLASKGIRTE